MQLLFRCPVLLLLILSASAAEGLWWEAEAPSATNFPAPSVPEGPGADTLSDGRWIGVDKAWTQTPFLHYEITVPEAGRYQLYARKFWKHGPFRWRFNDQDWASLGTDVALLDHSYIRRFWGANWVLVGDCELAAGSHSLELEMTDPDSVAYFDCFFLTREPFYPLGRHKPFAPLPEAAPGWVTFNDYDTLLDPSPIDLRYLNEERAGDRGFIGIQGDHFVQAGQPIRFCGVGGGSKQLEMSRPQVRTLARVLARKGINMIRFHSPIIVTSGPLAGQIDEKRLDRLFFLIDTMAQEGIFTHLSIYFPLWFRPGETGLFPGLGNDQVPFALQFFSRRFQDWEENWWRALMTSTSPYSGRALRDDPAVMGAEILNEDSLFFWTFSDENIPAQQMAILEARFGDWLRQRYGSLTALERGDSAEAWGRVHEHDDVASGRIGFVALWELFNDEESQRERDTARFLAEVQKAYFDERFRFLREDLGFRGVLCGSNWRTANSAVLGPIDKWTQVGGDFYDHHGYWGAWRHFDRDNDIHYYADKSLSAWQAGPNEEFNQLQLPFLPAVIAGKPGMVSEYAWTGLNACRSEMPLITAALASQNGLDALSLFSLDSTPAWRATVKSSWPVLTPSALALYPGKALLFRKGLVAETAARSTVTINVEDMLNLQVTGFTDPSANDANRAGDGRDQSRQSVTMQHFAHGKVAVEYSNDQPSATTLTPAISFHDPEEKILRGASGDIDWPYGHGIFTVRAPQVQAVSGYLARAGRIVLPSLSISSDLPFGVVWATALDDRPLDRSQKMLLQVMSESRNHRFQTEGDPKKRIVHHGEAPIEIRALSGQVAFARADAATLRVTALDINGVPIAECGTANQITLQPSVIYYLIEAP